MIELSGFLGAEERNKNKLKDIEIKKIKKQEAIKERLEAERLEDELKSYDSDRAKLMQSKINEVFDYCSILLEKQRKDGTWEDTCEIAYDGIIRY